MEFFFSSDYSVSLPVQAFGDAEYGYDIRNTKAKINVPETTYRKVNVQFQSFKFSYTLR
jgi:hypothetical protein